MKKIFGGFFYTAVILVIFLLISNLSIIFYSKKYLYHTVEMLPKRKVGVVLGTSKYLIGGGINSYYKFRMDAAYKAFIKGKVDYLLLSGDNRTREYNEPIRMKKTLVNMGVPEERIFLDYAGFRTLDSIVRAKRIFGEERFIVISQGFQNERAIYIGRHKGIDIIGLNASDPKMTKVVFREIFAKSKTFLDIHLLDTQPRYLGEKIDIK